MDAVASLGMTCFHGVRPFSGHPIQKTMNPLRRSETVAVLGASPKPERYAYKAFEMLQEYGHRPIPINPAFEEILGEKCYPKISDAPKPIDTITLYLGEARLNPLIEELVEAKAHRIN